MSTLQKRMSLFTEILIGGFLLLSTSFAQQEPPQPIPTIPLSPKAEGTIDFRVDDMSIFSQTKVLFLKNLLASEIEPFIKTRLSKFGSVQTNDAENLLIITEREPKLSDLERLVKKLDEIGKKGFLRLETEIVPLQYMKASKVLGIAKQRLSLEGTVQADDGLNIIIITDLLIRA
ncbi:MAG: hypothetical protein AB1393_08135 [Candidatus Edwardsbacteria bacterium]